MTVAALCAAAVHASLVFGVCAIVSGLAAVLCLSLGGRQCRGLPGNAGEPSRADLEVVCGATLLLVGFVQAMVMVALLAASFWAPAYAP